MRGSTLLLVMWMAAWSGAQPLAENFDAQPAGPQPPGWQAAVTGEGTGQWRIEASASAPSAPNVLVQNGVGTFPLCVAPSTLADGALQVLFCFRSGQIDQAAGIVFRYQDPYNYYVVRANAREDNIVAYKVEKGLRTPLDPVGPAQPYSAHFATQPGQWYKLRVEFAGPRFHVFLDGQPVMDVLDPTFAGEGRVGLWTRADSVTAFDDFVVERP